MEVAWTGISCNQDPKFPRSALWQSRAAISSGLYVPRENHPLNILNNCLMFIKTDFWPLRLTTISSWGRSVKSQSKGFHAIKQTGAIVVFRLVTFHFTCTQKICHLFDANLKEDSEFGALAWSSRNLCTVLLLTGPEPRGIRERCLMHFNSCVCRAIKFNLHWTILNGWLRSRLPAFLGTQLNPTNDCVSRVLVFSSTSKQMRILQFSCFSSVTAWHRGVESQWSEDWSSQDGL